MKSSVVSITFENPKMRGTWEQRQCGMEGGRPHVFGLTLTPGQQQPYKWDGMEDHLHYLIIFHLYFYQSYKCHILSNQTILPDLLQKRSVPPPTLSFPHQRWFSTQMTMSPHLTLNNTLILLLLHLSFLGIICWLPTMEDREFNSFSSSFIITCPSSSLTLSLQLCYNFA